MKSVWSTADTKGKCAAWTEIPQGVLDFRREIDKQGLTQGECRWQILSLGVIKGDYTGNTLSYGVQYNWILTRVISTSSFYSSLCLWFDLQIIGLMKNNSADCG